ncbi:MAG: hypothetical protein LPK45_02830, partial [Bacteroidota bacterium]|nr:hypothetical protein [Bacteroidota bacterium]MDX5429974.1 hypothetical protein [Bacteroidota bacterium]MDX5468747.1 hypothetical protein [Bacteroidota bacterium]
MRRLKLLIVLMGFACMVNAQTFRINNQCNPLVNSLENVVYLVRQDYALQGKDGGLYGQNNQSFYAYRYGAGIVWNGQLYMSPLTYFAHRSDSSIRSFGDEYTGVPTTTYYRLLLTKEAFTKIDSGALKVNPQQAMLPMTDSTASGKQPKANQGTHSKKYLLVTFECKDHEWTDTSVFKLNFLYTDLYDKPNGQSLTSVSNLGHDVRFALLFNEILDSGSAYLEFLGFAEM